MGGVGGLLLLRRRVHGELICVKVVTGRVIGVDRCPQTTAPLATCRGVHEGPLDVTLPVCWGRGRRLRAPPPLLWKSNSFCSPVFNFLRSPNHERLIVLNERAACRVLDAGNEKRQLALSPGRRAANRFWFPGNAASRTDRLRGR